MCPQSVCITKAHAARGKICHHNENVIRIESIFKANVWVRYMNFAPSPLRSSVRVQILFGPNSKLQTMLAPFIVASLAGIEDRTVASQVTEPPAPRVGGAVVVGEVCVDPIVHALDPR